MSKSYLEVNGTYDPTKRFAFTNITDEDFTSYWNGQPISVKSGATKELTHHLAVKMTIELVDKIMVGISSIGGQFISVKGVGLGIPEQRKVWEDKILRELMIDEESPEIKSIREQVKKEMEKNIDVIPIKEEKNISEFEDLGKVEENKQEDVISDKPKRGRPKK